MCRGTSRPASIRPTPRTPPTRSPAATPPRDRAARSRCRRRAPAISRPARCSTGYRAVDRLPESPSAPAVRGTLVHAVLEQMFGRPGPDRTPDAAAASIGLVWQELIEEYPELAGLVPTRISTRGWRPPRIWCGPTSASRIRAASRPRHASSPSRSRSPRGSRSAASSTGSTCAATGELRIVDYKTGASPDPDFEAKALYQLKFYALMIYRLRGVVPSQLKLIYLGDVRSLQYTPSEAELLALRGGVIALWRTVRRALETGNFPAAAQQGLRLVRAPVDLSGVGRHAAALPRPPGSRPQPAAPRRRTAERRGRAPRRPLPTSDLPGGRRSRALRAGRTGCRRRGSRARRSRTRHPSPGSTPPGGPSPARPTSSARPTAARSATPGPGVIAVARGTSSVGQS